MRRYVIWSGIAVVIVAALAGGTYLITTWAIGSRASFELVLEFHSDTLARRGIPPTQHVLIFKEPYQWRHTWNMSPKIQNTEVCDGRTLVSTTIFQGQPPKLERYDIAKIEEKLGIIEGRSMLMLFKGVPAFLVDPNNLRWEYPLPAASADGLKPSAEELVDDVMTRTYSCDPKKDLNLKLWYGKEDGLMRRMVMTTGTDRNWITVKKVTIGPTLGTGEGFSTAVPLGQQVADRTAEFISITEAGVKKRANKP